MTAFELCGLTDFEGTFTIGKSKIRWEAASYKQSCDKVYVSRVIQDSLHMSGKPFLLGLRYKFRYIKPETRITINP